MAVNDGGVGVGSAVDGVEDLTDNEAHQTACVVVGVGGGKLTRTDTRSRAAASLF